MKRTGLKGLDLSPVQTRQLIRTYTVRVFTFIYDIFLTLFATADYQVVQREWPGRTGALPGQRRQIWRAAVDKGLLVEEGLLSDAP
jgi:hypothetical protein